MNQQYKPKLDEDKRQTRKEVYENIRDAFGEKYNFLGAQVARECLLSAASWNIDKYSDPPMRYRNHIMLTWDPGWLKSNMLMRMKDILGDDLVKTCGKVTEAVMRGSVNGGRFSPPTVLQAPIVVSTEFGQTEFEGELLHSFLNLLEEGETNTSLNKIAGLSEATKDDIEERYKGEIKFRSENEFDLNTSFVFWGATHEPELLTENALKSRFNVVTPAKPLTGKVTEAIDKSPPLKQLIDGDTVKAVRRMIKSKQKVRTDFKPPSSFYDEYTLTPRESRDVQSYMAARNWWGLDVNPKVMEEYITHLKRSRRIASMNKYERVMDLIFDNPMTYDELINKTGYDKRELYKILERIDAERAGVSGDDVRFIVRSGESKNRDEDNQKEKFFTE